MTSDEVRELRRRAHDVMQLGRPQPAVSVDVALLITDLLLALEAAVGEVERLRG